MFRGWSRHEFSCPASGSRPYGRIVAGATGSHPAFSASYDLVTDDTGATKRLSLTVTLAERDRQLSIARDEENMWSITGHQGESRGAFDGALDVDVVFSPFFNVWDRVVVTNWSVVGLFLVLFVAGLGVIGWLVSVVARAQKAMEGARL